MLDADLRALLVCPVDHQALRDEDDTLVCTVCGRRYPMIDGIPQMIATEEKE
jgi:uncharacterized protein YbaR (Trm112 family)